MGYSNTVVAASDMNYFWGVFLMIASMRCYGMREPVIVLGTGYTPEAGRLLSQFGDVTVHEASPSSRSLTCRKPEALLLAETDYATWVDCDGFFSGNCSALLTPPDQDHIRIRRRSLRENLNVYPDAGGRIPDDVLDVWRRDVGERAEARLDTCCSACFMSVPGKHRKFLERWRDQMARVLPDGDVGVVDHRTAAYFQTDESVLNSLLCFMEDAPLVTEEYGLDRDPDAVFIHFVCHPKPWRAWTPYAFRHFDRYLAVVDYLLEQGYDLPEPLPFALRRENKSWCRLLEYPVLMRHKFQRLRRRLGL